MAVNNEFHYDKNLI